MFNGKNFDIFEHYSVQEILAKREYSSTYLVSAKDQAAGQTIIKVFHHGRPSLLYDDTTLEIHSKTLVSLRHQFIVPLFDILFDGTQLYIIRAYLSYDTLNQRLLNLPLRRLPWEETLTTVLKIGSALNYAHNQGITHNNIKPENILYNNNDPMLTDFSLTSTTGLSTFVYPSNIRTAHYMAPEQFIGQTSPLSDQYALACLVYTLVSGHPPFEGNKFTALWNKHANEHPVPLSTLLPHIPVSFARATMNALAKNPAERYPNIESFLLALASGSDILSTQPALSTDTIYPMYNVDINTSLPDGVFAHNNTQLDFPSTDPATTSTTTPDTSSSTAPLLDPAGETMTMFVVGDTLALDNSDHTVHAGSTTPTNQTLPPTPDYALPILSANKPLLTFSSPQRTNRTLFLATLLLLLVLFASTCLALVFHQPTSIRNFVFHPQITTTISAPSTHAATNKPGLLATHTPSPAHPSPQSAQPTPPTSSIPPAQPTLQSISTPTAQPTTPSQQPNDPFFGYGNPHTGGYGPWQHRSPFFPGYFRP